MLSASTGAIALVLLLGLSCDCPHTITPCGPVSQPSAGPPTLHFIWVKPFLQEGPNPSVAKAWQIARTWKNLTTPAPDIMVWTRTEIVAHFPTLVPLLERLPTPAWISDIVRYHVVHAIGGLYLDTDVIPLRDPTPLWRQLGGAFAVCENPWTDPSTATVSQIHSDAPCNTMINAIIAAPKHHPATFCAKHNSAENTREMLARGNNKYNLDATGPSLWTHCIRQHPCTIRILPSWTFTPCRCCEDGCRADDYRDTLAIGMHAWAKSWVGTSQDESKALGNTG